LQLRVTQRTIPTRDGRLNYFSSPCASSGDSSWSSDKCISRTRKLADTPRRVRALTLPFGSCRFREAREAGATEKTKRRDDGRRRERMIHVRAVHQQILTYISWRSPSSALRPRGMLLDAAACTMPRIFCRIAERNGSGQSSTAATESSRCLSVISPSAADIPRLGCPVSDDVSEINFGLSAVTLAHKHLPASSSRYLQSMQNHPG